MDEFTLINNYFNRPINDGQCIRGIGDDAAIIRLKADEDLLISTDTLVSGLHFLPEWSPHSIAKRSVAVNVSDIAAMGGASRWISLALTLPEASPTWLEQFSRGLHQSLQQYNISLIGGDTNRGPLSITIGIYGVVPRGKGIQRNTASAGDAIYISGTLGAAALAVEWLDDLAKGTVSEREQLMIKLKQPVARVDLLDCIQTFASACIDISDGLSADLHHICEQSQLGAILYTNEVPVDPLVLALKAHDAINLALNGGDAYELCFTVPQSKEAELSEWIIQKQLDITRIGKMIPQPGIYLENADGRSEKMEPRGFKHFS